MALAPTPPSGSRCSAECRGDVLAALWHTRGRVRVLWKHTGRVSLPPTPAADPHTSTVCKSVCQRVASTWSRVVPNPSLPLTARLPLSLPLLPPPLPVLLGVERAGSSCSRRHGALPSVSGGRPALAPPDSPPSPVASAGLAGL